MIRTAIAFGILMLPAMVSATTATPSSTTVPTPTRTPCGVIAPPTLQFSLTTDPPEPVVGGDVTLRFSIVGGGGIPRYTLSGTTALFEGDTGPKEESSITGTVLYNLRAINAGETLVSLCVNFEYVNGCTDFGLPTFAFITMCSPDFGVNVGRAPSGSTPTPTPPEPVQTSTPCITFPPPHLEFGFVTEPTNPRIGDEVALTVSFQGGGGVPQYRLSGTETFFEGDVAPRSEPVVSPAIQYELRAVRPGIAGISMCVNFEFASGCVDSELPVFQFTTLCSSTFAVEVAPPLCVGDCDGDGTITVDDLQTGITIATGEAAVDACPPFDASGEGSVTVDEIVAATAGALYGCQGTP